MPTNVISITDGQIYLESDLFASGIRPAINAGLSVSRVGGAAQTKAMRKVAGGMRLGLAQYRELQAFAQFGTTDLDAATRRQIELGQRLVEILKQPQYNPLQLGQEVAILYAVVNGYLNDIEPAKIRDFEEAFLRYMESAQPEVLKAIDDTGLIDDATEASLKSRDRLVQADGSLVTKHGSGTATHDPQTDPHDPEHREDHARHGAGRGVQDAARAAERAGRAALRGAAALGAGRPRRDAGADRAGEPPPAASSSATR